MGENCGIGQGGRQGEEQSSGMLTLSTRDFGTVSVERGQLIHFPEGLFGFQQEQSFALLSPLGDEVSPMWLQSAATATPCFIVYKLDQLSGFDCGSIPPLDSRSKRLLELNDGDEAVWMGIIRVKDELKNSTINLKSPIVLNPVKRIGLQVILEGDFDIRHTLYPTEGGQG